MRKEIDGLLVPEWTETADTKSGIWIRSSKPTNYLIETDEEQISLIDLLEPFNDPGKAVFVRITIQEENVDGEPI